MRKITKYTTAPAEIARTAENAWMPQAHRARKHHGAQGDAGRGDDIPPLHAALDPQDRQRRQTQRQQQDHLQQPAQQLSEDDLHAGDRRGQQRPECPPAHLVADRGAEHDRDDKLGRHELEPDPSGVWVTPPARDIHTADPPARRRLPMESQADSTNRTNSRTYPARSA
jgi:hypothetical protein